MWFDEGNSNFEQAGHIERPRWRSLEHTTSATPQTFANWAGGGSSMALFYMVPQVSVLLSSDGKGSATFDAGLTDQFKEVRAHDVDFVVGRSRGGTPHMWFANYTSRQSNAHSTESREIRYPWHPWCGRSVWIYSTVVKGGITVRHGGTFAATGLARDRSGGR